MATKAEKNKKPATSPATLQGPRKLKKPKYASFQLSKRIKGDKLPSGFSIFKKSVGVLTRHWKLFLLVVVVYALLNTLLVQGFTAINGAGDAKTSLDQVFTGDWGRVMSGLTLFAYLLGVTGSAADATAGLYQLILALIISLALIWALRQVYAGNKIRMRDTFYNGMSPFVPFILVLLVIGLQLIPMAIGIALYATVVGAGISTTGLEQVMWALLAFVLSVVSLYMIMSSIFALYIVTLPGMTPMRALRSARQLVANRRWAVMRKVLFLPVALILLTALVVVPLLLMAATAGAWVFFILTMFFLPVTHSYMYSFYRSMV